MAGSKGYSVSAAQGDIAPEHDRREYEPGNADARLSANNNIIIDTPDERKAFNELFADSIEAYNAGQKRNDRKKTFDYLSEIENGKGAEKPFYEYVFQIGNRDTNGVTTSSFSEEAWKNDKKGYDIMSCVNNDADRLKLKEILDSEMASLQKRYPAFHFWSVIGHDDEPNGTYHYHVRFTPVGSGYKNGMDKRCSLTKALHNMGFYSDGADYGITQWQNDVKDHIAEAMEKEGYYREFMSNEEEHLSVPLYKLKKEKEKLNAQIAEQREELADIRFSYKNVSDLRFKEQKKLEKLNAEKGIIMDGIIVMYENLQVDRYLENQELIEEFGQIQIERCEMELEKEEADALKGKYEQKMKELGNLIAEVENFSNAPSTVSEDADYSRKAYMETIKMSNGISAEDAYQKKLAREKKAEADRKAKADAYVKKAEQIREPSKQAGKQLHKPNSAVKKAFEISDDAEERKKRENDMQYY